MNHRSISFRGAVVAGIVAMAVVFCVPSAFAQPQSKDQQRCLTGVAKRARKVSATVIGEGAKCVAKAAKGKLAVTADACITNAANAKRAKARSKVGQTIAKSCGTPPGFAFTDETIINNAHEGGAEAMFTDAFGLDVDATLLAAAGIDPKGRCSASLHKRARKIADLMQKEFAGCVKDGLRDTSILNLDDFEDCLVAITDDGKSRIGKQADKLGGILTKKCSEPDLTTIFPGLDSICTAFDQPITGLGLGECTELRSRCRVCLILEEAHGFNRGCDDFDNGEIDGTCPECPNGVVDVGEECDDGNMDDGDGCTIDCITEFCGDGVVNNGITEECDDGMANSDVTPDACRSNCALPFCGDGVTDSGEECDDANLDDDDGCTTSCTACGNGTVTAPEVCDDGNTDDGDCCRNDCTVAPDGTPCPISDSCTKTAECTAGICESVLLVVSGDACPYSVVGESVDDTILRTGSNAMVDGPWCGSQGDIALGTTFFGTGDLVFTEDDGSGLAASFGAAANVDSGDIVTNFGSVEGKLGVDLPGLPGTSTLAAGLVQSKTPAPTFYDTTGTDPRVSSCLDAQAALATMASDLDALTVTQNLGTTYESITTGTTLSMPPVPASVIAGGLNVYDLTNITGGNDVVINIHGGFDPDTVVIVRVDDRIDSDLRWEFNLVDGLLPQNVLFYGKSTAQFRCELGEDNIFNGTLFCPNTRTDVKQDSVVVGSVMGGGGGGTGRVLLGEDTVLTHVAFTGL